MQDMISTVFRLFVFPGHGDMNEEANRHELKKGLTLFKRTA